MTMQPQSLLVTVKNQYTAAGLLDTQTSTHPTSPGANSNTKNLYDNHGILQSYTYTKGDGSEPTPIMVSGIPIPIAIHSRRGR